MSEFTVYSPEGKTASAARKALKTVEDIHGQRVALLWGMHDLSTKFWPVFEREVLDIYKPREVHKHYKEDTGDGKFKGNTWIPAPLSDIQEMASQVDYAVAGVGA
jgi:hypothetical protein